MRTDHIPCGEFANDSERGAIEWLSAKLRAAPGDHRWILLSNVASSVNPTGVPDEIDLIALGHTGLFVIEIKHWDRAFLKAKAIVVEAEATKLNDKIRRLASKIRKAGLDVGFLAGRFLLTKDDQPWKQNRLVQSGSMFFAKCEWRELLDITRDPSLSPQQIEGICHAIQPLTSVTLTGQVRRLAQARNLELLSPKEERFHRVFRGEHARFRDKIVLHLFDLSATTEPKPEVLASREFEVLHRLQRFRSVPRVLDSFQEVPDYPGELFYFSLVDPCAPTIASRAQDPKWSMVDRRRFAARACKALAELHVADLGGTAFVHRHLTPTSILVGHQDQPIFTSFHWARGSGTATVANAWNLSPDIAPFVAPEVRTSGLARADQRSDVFSLCASLSLLFNDETDTVAQLVNLVLEEGMVAEPERRQSLVNISSHLDAALVPAIPVQQELPSARYWSEGLTIPFNAQKFRVVSALGSGSFGTTFKIVEILDGDQEGGSFVGKVVFSREAGERALKAYRRVRPYTTGSNLAAVFEVASTWNENGLLALMKWINGNPLFNLIGLLELYAEDLSEPDSAALVGRWVLNLCEALSELHRAGLVHGDVSTKNILECGGNVSLVDYDLVLQSGDPVSCIGTPIYAPRELKVGVPASFSQDVFALGASMFHVLFDREPFLYGGNILHERGLNWEGIARDKWGWCATFLDRATSFSPEGRFRSASEAASWIRAHMTVDTRQDAKPLKSLPRTSISQPKGVSPELPMSPQQVPRLADLLATYPGSPRGSIETRGLDSPFAHNTYVSTALEEQLFREVQRREAQLVILCGNAGDGKTAFLQNLALRLGLPTRQSAERVWERCLPDGLKVVINLDGAASYKNRSSDEMLDQFFSPFQNGPSADARVHLLAVNDGRLLQWVEEYEARVGTPTYLTQWIYETLLGDRLAEASHIRLINLNNRSLVGALRPGSPQLATEFLDNLLDKLLGDEQIWQNCRQCTAGGRCTANQSVRLLFEKDSDGNGRGRRIRARFAEALQAVHQRGQVHITTRELRGALTYIFFGTHFCDDLHANPDLVLPPYWDRAFDPESPLRQGELLAELRRFDPALDSHPLIDRYLKSSRTTEESTAPPRYPQLSLASARRRAYFEWSEQQVSDVAQHSDAHGLARGDHHRLFASVAGMSLEEREAICARLCAGISRLQYLPRTVLKRTGIVPLKIQPRTPVETTFWIEKQLSRFELVVDRPASAVDVEWLHNCLTLNFIYQGGRKESLLLGSDLFSLLLDLSAGYQLMDTSTDDIFANLSIFTQRLAEDDERDVFAFEPGHEAEIFHISTEISNSIRQLKMTSVSLGSTESPDE